MRLRRGTGVRTLALLVAGLALVCAPLDSSARAQDAGDVELGMSLYKTVGGCAACHAWTGRGALLFDPGNGFIDPPPSLVTSTLDRAAMIALLACGTPGGKMPQYLAEAWSEKYPCYGKQSVDLPPDQRPPRAYSALTLRQIEALASFVVEVYQGKGMSLENCVKYHGPPARVCDLQR